MSTVFCEKIVSYLIYTKQFSFRKDMFKTLNKSLTDRRVSKTGRPDLYCRCSYRQVIKHVIDRLDASET